jgi:AcrR family transcriptional regulator
VALELFARDGFAATTVSAIAEAAEVAPRTVSTYFPSKEGIVFGEYRAAIDRLAARLEGRGEGETVADALRAWLSGEETVQPHPGRALVRRDNGAGVDLARLREIAIERDVDLWGIQRRETKVMRRMIGDAWADEHGLAHDSLEARMIGATSVAALLELNAHAARAGTASTESLDTVLAFLEAGIASYRK